jgi:hypothetical protein
MQQKSLIWGMCRPLYVCEHTPCSYDIKGGGEQQVKRGSVAALLKQPQGRVLRVCVGEDVHRKEKAKRMGRRLILLLSAMATMVVVSAGVALAVVIIGTNAGENCTMGIPGQPAPTEQADDITLAGGGDTCNGLGGADEIYGDSGSDDIDGGNGADDLYGGGGANNTVNGGGSNGDWVSVVDGDTDDTAEGGPGGGDTCAVDNPNEAAVPPDPNACETVLYARAP